MKPDEPSGTEGNRQILKPKDEQKINTYLRYILHASVIRSDDERRVALLARRTGDIKNVTAVLLAITPALVSMFLVLPGNQVTNGGAILGALVVVVVGVLFMSLIHWHERRADQAAAIIELRNSQHAATGSTATAQAQSPCLAPCTIGRASGGHTDGTETVPPLPGGEFRFAYSSPRSLQRRLSFQLAAAVNVRDERAEWPVEASVGLDECAGRSFTSEHARRKGSANKCAEGESNQEPTGGNAPEARSSSRQ